MIALALGFLQFAILWGIGLTIHPRLGFLPRLLQPVTGFALAQTGLSYLLLLLGWFSLYTNPVLALLCVLLLIPGVFGWYRYGRQCLTDVVQVTRRHPIAMGLLFVLLAIQVLGACVPEREVDSLWYHLAVPQQYLLHGGIVTIPYNLPSHYPMNMHLHYVLSLWAGNDATAKAFSVSHWAPLLVTVYALVRLTVGRRWGVVACLLLLSCIHFQLPVMSNVQRPLYLYVLNSTGLLWLGMRSGNRTTLLLSAILCGMAVGTKYNALFFALGAQLVFLLTYACWRPMFSRFQMVSIALIHLLIATLMLAPWFMKSWRETGNPVYPLAGSMFGANEDYRAAMHTYEDVHGLAILKADSFATFVTMVQENMAWMLYNADLFVFLALVSVLVLPFVSWKRARPVWCSTVILLAMFPLFWGLAMARLYSVTYGVFVIAITAMLAGLVRKSPGIKWLIPVVVLSMVVSFAQQKLSFVSSPNIRWDGVPILSEAARQEWLLERSVVEPGFFDQRDWIHKNVDEDSVVYAYDAGYPFYLNRKVILSDALFGEQLDQWLEQGIAYERLRVHGVTHVLDGGKQRITRSESLQALWDQFRTEHLVELYTSGDMILYFMKHD